jgi:hypothetical protein
MRILVLRFLWFEPISRRGAPHKNRKRQHPGLSYESDDFIDNPVVVEGTRKKVDEKGIEAFLSQIGIFLIHWPFQSSTFLQQHKQIWNKRRACQVGYLHMYVQCLQCCQSYLSDDSLYSFTHLEAGLPDGIF